MDIRQNQMAVERDMSDFKKLVNELGRKINGAGALWRDAKYHDLRDSVSRMASDSKMIFAQSERCYRALKQFAAICEED